MNYKKAPIVTLFLILLGYSSLSQNKSSDSKMVLLKDIKISIPKPSGYDYFENSIFKNYTIEKLTQTEQLGDAIINIEYLIPQDLKNQPTIHIYTYRYPDDFFETKSSFDNSKKMAIAQFENGTYKKIADDFFKDTSISKLSDRISVSQNGYIVLNNTETTLSIMIMSSVTDPAGIELKVAHIQNLVFIKGRIYTVKLVISRSDISKLTSLLKSNEYFLTSFIKDNQ